MNASDVILEEILKLSHKIDNVKTELGSDIRVISADLFDIRNRFMSMESKLMAIESNQYIYPSMPSTPDPTLINMQYDMSRINQKIEEIHNSVIKHTSEVDGCSF